MHETEIMSHFMQVTSCGGKRLSFRNYEHFKIPQVNTTAPNLIVSFKTCTETNKSSY